MRLQTMTPPSAMLVALCTLLMSGCGVSTSPEEGGPGSRNQAEELGDSRASDVPEKGEGVTLCHLPPGNPANKHTLTVGAPAVNAHLRHGDYLGACEGTSEPDAGTPPIDGGSPSPEPDAGTPGPVDGGQTCAERSQACGDGLPCCNGLSCQAGFCSPVLN